MAVLDRSLYNHRLNIKERSRLKKSVLWEEIKNIVGGTIKYYKVYWILQIRVIERIIKLFLEFVLILVL